MPIGNVLIVEDDKDWQGIYLRNAKPLESGRLRVVATLEEALTAIVEMAFAVAFIDIRLDEADDENTDGLRVFEALRKTGDHTCAIMLTGHGNVAITRDALKEFDAFEALAKSEIGPEEIQDLIVKATGERNREAKAKDAKAPQVLRGRRTVWDWDSEMLEVTGSKGGADGLYRLVESLADPFLPLVGGSEQDHVKRRESSDLASGSFWSRAVGEAVFIAFGSADAMSVARANGDLESLAEHPVGEVLREREKGGLAGLVASVPDRSRSTFS